MITLLVDNILNDTFATPTSDVGDPCVREVWEDYNQSLLNLYRSHDFFCIIPIKDYNNNHTNPYYLINMRSWEDFVDPAIWKNIPKSSLDVLVKHNIPILLWYPLEGPDNSILTDWHNIMKMRAKVGLTNNKLVLLSVCDLLKYYPKKKSINNLNNNKLLDTIFFVPSVNYTIKCAKTKHYMIDKDTFDTWNTVCSITDHNDLSLKNKDFVCLNNVIDSRINRLLLLQSLYTKGFYKENIISSRWQTSRDNKNLFNDANARRECFLDSLKNLLFYHDKKITSDAQLHKLIKTLYNTHDNDLKNELLKIIESGRVTRSVKFLCNLILQSLKNDSSIFPKKIIDLDHHQVLYNRESPNLNSCWNNDWYKTSWFSIITESWHFHPYQKSDNIQLYFPMISEKTIKAIMNNHPFIIFSAPGTSRLINKFGFKTFNQPLLGLPENFDEEVIPVTERLYIFIEALKKFSAKSHGEKVNIWNSIKPDIVYNTRILRKTDWIKVQHDLILEYGGC